MSKYFDFIFLQGEKYSIFRDCIVACAQVTRLGYHIRRHTKTRDGDYVIAIFMAVDDTEEGMLLFKQQGKNKESATDEKRQKTR